MDFRVGEEACRLEHHGDLAPEAEEALCDAIRDAYDMARLKRLLFFRCGRIRIEDIATGVNFEEIVFEVFLAAKEGGWLTGTFIPQVLAGNPGNPMLKEWARKYRGGRNPAGRRRGSRPCVGVDGLRLL